ncbi:MAG: SH3 domain-containing protein [Clostridia bacterium]|nr:SH3 domain-containing protein [Clostridia bacterium]
MIKNKAVSIILASLMIFGTAVSSLASGGYYLPYVNGEMSSPSYWTQDNEILMTPEEISALNKSIISTKGTNMYDLKNQAETVNGISLNESLLKSGRADAEYYLGWTFLEKETKATMEEYEVIIANTQNPDAEKEQKVLYGIATKRTELRAFPSDTAIWDEVTDTDFDYQYLVGVRVNEPVVIISKSADGRYYLAKNVCCSGWIPADSVAICKDKEEWISAWDIKNEDALVVWGDKVFTETTIVGEKTSDLLLTMGTVLELAKDIDPNVLIDNRSAYNNFVVWIPVRNEDGSYAKKLTLISEHKNVHKGYLPFTKANIAKVTFSALGNIYGWGGMLNSEDCSGYMRSIYKCFGLELARNTTWQTAMPVGKVDMKNMPGEERIKFLDAIPFGTILYISGHEMMYLGSEDGRYYVISAAGNVVLPGESKTVQRIRSIVINTLDMRRTNGNTWFDEITTAIIPFYDAVENPLPDYEWYHEGAVYCLKNKIMQGDENKLFNPSNNVTWAELMQILFNMEKPKPVIETEEGAPWYTAAVVWATENSLVHENDKDYNPDAPMTREQLATVLYLYAQYKNNDTRVGEETNILSYDDATDVSEYAIPAMQYVTGAGLINGKTATTLNPKDNTTRAEIAVILDRLNKYNIRMEEIRKTTVDYTRDFTSFTYQPESADDAVTEHLKAVDRCSYGTAGSSLSQLAAGVSVLELSVAEDTAEKLTKYLDGMDATQRDYFSFQWQMCMKKARAILEKPSNFKDEMSDAGIEDFDASAYSREILDKLNDIVMSELEKRGVKDEWKNHPETEPFDFWEE